MDKAATKQHLAKVEQQIVKAEACITRQREMIVEYSAAGRRTKEAEELLDTLMETQKTLLLMRQQSLFELSELGDQQAT